MHKNPASHSLKRIEFLVITPNEKILSVGKDIADFFLYRSEIVKSLEDVSISTRTSNVPLMILTSLENGAAVSESLPSLEVLHKSFPRSKIVLVTAGGEKAEDLMRLKDVGADHIVTFDEVHGSSKLYYLSSFMVRGSYLPVPVTDFFPGSEMGFNAYQKLALNQKYLPVFFAGLVLSDKKYRRLESGRDVYLRRRDLNSYRRYIETYHDTTGNALKKRCRATLIHLLKIYSDLVLLLTLESKTGQQEMRDQQMEELNRVATELGDYLKTCPDVWNVIAQSLDFPFCRVERGLHVMAYAAILCLQAEVGRLEEVIGLALMSSSGLLSMPASTYKALQEKGPEGLSPQDLETYHRHHPKPGDPLPVEATLLLFCEILDRRLATELQEGFKTHDLIRKTVWEEEKVSLARFDAEFLDKIEKVLIA